MVLLYMRSERILPGGTAIIDNKRLDVVSRGEYIEKDRNLIVVEVTGNQIIVREN